MAAKKRSRVAKRRKFKPSGDSLDQRFKRAVVAHRAGDAKTAESHYQKVLAKDPNHFEALHLLGALLLRRRDFSQAHRIIARAVKINPTSAQTHNNLGRALHKLGRIGDAIAHYRKAIELRGGYVDAMRNLASALRDNGELQLALETFSSALEFEPHNPRLHNALGSIRQMLGQLESAQESYQTALDLRPDLATTMFNLAVLAQERSQLEEARRWYERVLADDPNNIPAVNNLGILAAYERKTPQVMLRLRQAVESAADEIERWLQLGIAYWQEGEFANADESLRTAQALDASNDDVLYYRALVQRDSGHHQAAREYLERARALGTENPLVEAALLSLDAIAATPSGTGGRMRIALHLAQPYHFNILRPIFEELRASHSVIFATHFSELVRFAPHVVVGAESQAAPLRARLPDTTFVWVRHGLISKNATCYAARSADYACLTSEDSKDWYIAHGGKPRKGVWVTGYPQMDRLFRRETMPLALTTAEGNRVVLYAPTWTPGLSSAEMLGSKLARLIRGKRKDISIVIKPHPVTAAHRPEWLRVWKKLADQEPEVFLIDNPGIDVMPFLAHADLLVSDASSVVFQFLATDRPIVLLTNPDRFATGHFDPKGIEWQWRDVGTEVTDPALLSQAVSDGLDQPELGSERRAHYRERLFGERIDGHAARRIAQHIEELPI